VRLSVLIPWRSNDPDRIRGWDYCRSLWERLPVELCVADDGVTDGPFSLSRAINRAQRQATGDAYAIFGADHIPDPNRIDWIVDRLQRHPWTAVYAGTQVLSPTATALVIRTGMHPAIAARKAGSHWIGMCMGVVAVRADAWIPMDPRFAGWGCEDTAHRLALATLYPEGNPDGEGDVYTVWHPDRHGTEELTERNYQLYREYEEAAAEGRMREYLQEAYGVRLGDHR